MTAKDTWNEVRAMDAKIDLKMGPNFVDRFLGDPKRIGFLFARYAFAAKMLRGCETILDLGCGSGEATVTFLEDTQAASIIGMDFDKSLIGHARVEILSAVHDGRPKDWGRLSFIHDDFMKAGVPGFDGIASMDVLEHIDPEDSPAFLRRIFNVLNDHGIAVIGTPNKKSEHLASAHSAHGHINSMTPDELRAAMKAAGWVRPLMFGMNDGTLNVGHPDLWHYVFAVACK